MYYCICGTVSYMYSSFSLIVPHSRGFNLNGMQTENDSYWKNDKFLLFATCVKIHFLIICIQNSQKILRCPPIFFFFKWEVKRRPTKSSSRICFALITWISNFFTENLLSSLIRSVSFRREERRARWSLESGSEPRWSETCDILGRILDWIHLLLNY